VSQTSLLPWRTHKNVQAEEQQLSAVAAHV
jgi:hypothetical protein